MRFVTTLNRGLHLRAEGEAKRAFEDIHEDELESLRHVFDEVDADQSGQIDLDELREAMRRAGKNVSRQQARALFVETDQDGDGTIDFKEFAEMFAKAAVNDDFEESEPGSHNGSRDACDDAEPENEVDQESIAPSCIPPCGTGEPDDTEIPEGHSKIEINVSRDDLIF